MEKVIEKAKLWLTDPFDAETQQEIQSLFNSNLDDLTDRFYQDLEFGTGGMRGVMGAGTNRINKYTLGKATQGLSNYLKSFYQDQHLKVAVAYDCRHNSKELAKLVADVLSANDISVFVFEDLRPTPELSFAVSICSGKKAKTPLYNSRKAAMNMAGCSHLTHELGTM